VLDVLEIVIAPIALPIGTAPLAEILVNDTSLAELVEAVEPEGTGYAPLLPAKVIPWLRDSLELGLRPALVQVLGCCCGVDRCSWVQLVMTSNEKGVRWGSITTSRSADEELPIGPFIFAREQYEAAIAAPRQADVPVRPYGS
jgi:hypothetical protein